MFPDIFIILCLTSKDAARFKQEPTSMGSWLKCSYIKASEDIIFHSKYFSFAVKLL